MKKNYKLKLLTALIVASVSIGGANAFNPKLIATTIIPDNSENWELIKEEDGIRAYITIYESIDQTLAYKIKFVNTTNADINFSWSLVNKESKSIYSEKTTKVKANGSEIIFDQQSPISVQYGEKISDILIKFNIQ